MHNYDPDKSLVDFDPFIQSRRKGLTQSVIDEFQSIIYEYYRQHGRKFPWRETDNTYHILLSEIMLQQTQTSRVISKYEQFIYAFPDFPTLAAAPLRKILSAWQGLGYNRRALNLKKIAERVVGEFNGRLPSSPEVLETFPGIGKATASAIGVFAFEQPVAFVETNIRAVYIYFFFQDTSEVKDKDILSLVAQTLDHKDIRQWYYGLMDYGVMLKKRFKSLGKKSAQYRRQPPFEGSDRQIRGEIIRILSAGPCRKLELLEKVKTAQDHADFERVMRIIENLEDEGFIKREGSQISIP